MAEAGKVTFALSRLTDHAFTDALSPRNKTSMADLLTDFFAEDLQKDVDSEDEPSKTILL